jgi:threonine dehydrogenase-like Zn-dependent dehydrogenase
MGKGGTAESNANGGQSMEHSATGRRMGHEFIGVIEDVGAASSGLTAAYWYGELAPR